MQKIEPGKVARISKPALKNSFFDVYTIAARSTISTHVRQILQNVLG